MGKIVVSQDITLGGVVGDPGGEGGFRHGGWFVQFTGQDREARAELELAGAQGAGALLTGRRSGEHFAARPAVLSGEWLDSLNRLPGYVVSAALQEPRWTNATVLAGEAASEVSRLRQQIQGEIAPAPDPHEHRGKRPRPPHLRARPRGLTPARPKQPSRPSIR